MPLTPSRHFFKRPLEPRARRSLKLLDRTRGLQSRSRRCGLRYTISGPHSKTPNDSTRHHSVRALASLPARNQHRDGEFSVHQRIQCCDQMFDLRVSHSRQRIVHTSTCRLEKPPIDLKNPRRRRHEAGSTPPRLAHFSTTCLITDDTLLKWPESPPNIAVMECVPTARLEVVNGSWSVEE
jgi:hypothetical protein